MDDNQEEKEEIIAIGQPQLSSLEDWQGKASAASGRRHEAAEKRGRVAEESDQGARDPVICLLSSASADHSWSSARTNVPSSEMCWGGGMCRSRPLPPSTMTQKPSERWLPARPVPGSLVSAPTLAE